MVPNAAIFTHIEPISDPASYDDEGLDRLTWPFLFTRRAG